MYEGSGPGSALRAAPGTPRPDVRGARETATEWPSKSDAPMRGKIKEEANPDYS